MTFKVPSISVIVALLFAGAIGLANGSAVGQTGDKPDEGKSKSKLAKSKPSKGDGVLAIVGGDIHTVTREVIRSGTVLIRDGKITKVGQRIDVPEGAEIIDATGMVVSPGFVALETSRVGVQSVSGSSPKVADFLDPFDQNVRLSLSVGITTACTSIGGGGGFRRFRDVGDEITIDTFLGLEPEASAVMGLEGVERDFGEMKSLCPCCGLPILPTDPITDPAPRDIQANGTAVLKMTYGSLDGMLAAEDVFYDLSPGSLTGALNQHTWRQQIAKARKYVADREAYESEVEKANALAARRSSSRSGSSSSKSDDSSETKTETPRPPRKTVDDRLIRLVKREIPLRIGASSASQIREMIELADELDLRLVISDPTEGWLVAEELAENDVAVTFAPRARRQARRGEEETSGSWIEMPRVLEQAGVPFATTALSSSISLNGLAGRDLTSLPLEAAFAVRGGASEAEALRSLTIHPAKMLGLADRIGSIEVGKDADILIMTGQPLDYQTYVDKAIVNGRLAYDRNRDAVLPLATN